MPVTRRSYGELRAGDLAAMWLADDVLAETTDGSTPAASANQSNSLLSHWTCSILDQATGDRPAQRSGRNL